MDISPEQQEQALNQARMQMAQQQTQLLVSTVSAKCFENVLPVHRFTEQKGKKLAWRCASTNT